MLKKILEKIGSPYSAMETFVRWPFYHFFPSKKNPTALQPANLPFIDENQRESSTIKILFFGDLMPLRKEEVPHASPEFRQLMDRADLIVGNLEAPIIQTAGHAKASLGTTLQFSQKYLR